MIHARSDGTTNLIPCSVYALPYQNDPGLPYSRDGLVSGLHNLTRNTGSLINATSKKSLNTLNTLNVSFKKAMEPVLGYTAHAQELDVVPKLLRSEQQLTTRLSKSEY